MFSIIFKIIFNVLALLFQDFVCIVLLNVFRVFLSSFIFFIYYYINYILISDLVKYSETQVHEQENSVKYLRHENEELKITCEILRDQVIFLLKTNRFW